MEVKKKRLVLKTLSRNPLKEKLRAKKEAMLERAPLKRSYMRQPEDLKTPENS